jgi:glycolate oxidase
MPFQKRLISSLDDLSRFIAEGRPALFLGSRTSTVIPYDHLEQRAELAGITLVDLSTMPPKMEINEQGNLKIEGAINWKEARAFCRSKGRDILTSPTEELALVLSGIATSCTGERSFGYGALRDQLISVDFVDYRGHQRTLHHDKLLTDLPELQSSDAKNILDQYDQSFSPYRHFKNGPFPRLLRQTDLMTGTEGQLGVITAATLKTAAFEDDAYIFVRLPKWEEDDSRHLELYKRVQTVRHLVTACEFIDHNSLSYLDPRDRPSGDGDLAFLEIPRSRLEDVIDILLSSFTTIATEDFFEVPAAKCRELRMKIPRAIFEANTKMGVSKQGTDVQISAEHFPKLLELYRSWREEGIAYNLFGHFGDAHLHFNFMPTPDQKNHCQKLFKELYAQVLKWQGSPFAEHGIGLLKKDYIAPFHTPVQHQAFQLLKTHFDPNHHFFPQGYMGKIS